MHGVQKYVSGLSIHAPKALRAEEAADPRLRKPRRRPHDAERGGHSAPAAELNVKAWAVKKESGRGKN